MSEFKVGDKALVTGVRGHNIPLGEIVTVIIVDNEDEKMTYKVSQEHGGDMWVYNEDIKEITATPKETTLNGATYVLKEDPKPEHEWKFGDIAIHDDYGVGMVFSEPDYENDVRFAHDDDWDWADIKDLTFLRRADLSV